MRFGVIYTIEWDNEHWEGECPFEYGEHGGLFDLFERTEFGDSETGVYEKRGKHAKFVSKEALSRQDFERFLDYSRLSADSTETGGSLVGGMWGLGHWVPAISFSDSGSGDEFFENAYVTPIPDVPVRKFPDSQDPHEEYRIGQIRDAYRERCWVRVRDAVINTYRNY